VTGGVHVAAERRYRARAWSGSPTRALTPPEVRSRPGGACATLPAGLGGTQRGPRYLVVDLVAAGPAGEQPPLRVHLYQLGAQQFRIAGLERPADDDPPGL